MSETTQIQNQTQATQVMLDRYTIAKYLVTSDSLPSSFKTAGNILMAIQTGAEMGLEPMQSLNGLYCVNNKLSVWGSTQVFLLRKQGWRIKIGTHTIETCTVTVSKGDESYEYTSQKNDVIKGKAYGIAPKEKLFYHCISRILKFYIPEVMGGQNIYNESEIVDISSEVTQNSQINEPKAKKDALLEFIQNEVKDYDKLMELADDLENNDQKKAFELKKVELQPKTELAIEVEVAKLNDENPFLEMYK